MKLSFGCSLLLLSLYFELYSQATATSSIPSVKREGILSPEAEAAIKSFYEISTATDECSNNSVDSRCRKPTSNAAQTSYNDDQKEFSSSGLDSPSKLINRLRNVDKIDEDLGLQAMLSNTTTKPWLTTDTDSTLRQVILLHRHGDRTPINFPTKDPTTSEPFWAFHGYGQLTNRGKARLYLLGKIMRQHYDKFLKGSVNKNQRISRSSGSLRCIESAQVFLSSFMELNLPSSLDAPLLTWASKKDDPLGRLWQPINVQSVPTQFDGMLAESAECKSLTDEYMNVIDKSDEVKDIMINYKHEAEVMNAVLGFEIDHFYKWFWGSSQLEVERSYFADKMDPEILKIYDRMQEAGNLAIGAYQRTLTSKRLRTGLLMNDIVSNMKNFQRDQQLFDSNSNDLKKFVHYSAHDLTVVVMLGMLDNWKTNIGRPDYAANLVIELHQNEDDWYIEIYYMAEVPSEPVKLHLSECEKLHPKQLCTLDNFAQLMSKYMVKDWQTWMQECNNDFSKLNPYTPGK